MKAVQFGVAALVAIGSGGAALAQGASPAGTWLSQSGDTRVRIAPCGQGMCGTIVAARGQTKDTQNPDPNLRNRDLVGVRMITMSPSGAGQWSGSLYRYTDGQTFNGTLKMSGPNALELSGCVMGGMICRSQTWTRAN